MSNHATQQYSEYCVVSLLSQERFATVYLGEHLSLKTKVVIKVLQTSLSYNQQTSFLKATQTIAALSHPHIIRILDFGIKDELLFLITEYFPYDPLSKHYAKGTVLSVKTVLSYVYQIASALHFAHEHSVIHQDLRPENMLLGADSYVLLYNFVITPSPQGAFVTTPYQLPDNIVYMAPEQIKGQSTPESDQYALGIVVYEWLCGEPPFCGSSIEIAAQQLLLVPPPLRRKNQVISPAVEEVVMNALAKEPGQRFKNINIFAEALEQAVRTDRSIFSIPSPASAKGTTLPQLSTEMAPIAVTLSGAEPTNDSAVKHTIRLLTRRNVLASISLIGLTLVGISINTVAFQTPLLRYTGHTGSVDALMWSPPDITRIASGGNDFSVQVWDSATGNRLFTGAGHAGPVHSVSWSPYSQYLVSASGDHTAQIWDTAAGTRALVYKGHKAAVYGVSWSFDNKRIASGSADATVHIWDSYSGDNLGIYRGHAGAVYSVLWSLDNRRVASCSSDHTVQIWHAQTMHYILTYTGHTEAVYALTWSPDGNFIASGGSDQVVQVWNAQTGEHLLTYKGHTGAVRAVQWALDGQRVSSASDDSTVQVWRLNY